MITFFVFPKGCSLFENKANIISISNAVFKKKKFDVYLFFVFSIIAGLTIKS